MVRASASATASGLADVLGKPATDGSWTAAWLAAARAAGAAIDEALAMETELSEPAAHAALARSYAHGDLVYTASSMPIRDQEAYAKGTGADVRFLANRGANGIDGLVSSGIGAARATSAPAWILTGDLGLFHDLNALALARDAEAPIRIVVFENAGGGIFEFLPQAGEVAREEFEALFGTPTGLDCERAAALWGLPYRRAESPDDIVARADRTELIEVPVDRHRGVEVRRELMRAAAEATTLTLN
jgi:2-succinyl-5-enolpyruvyl-6-hydroxy-3-cyclohexene-1-carboxylate synthase